MAEPTDKDEAPPILEGEYVDSGKGARPRRRRWLPWILLFALAAFVGGLFAAPYAEDRLRAWGLLPDVDMARPAPVPAETGDGSDDRLTALDSTLQRLGSRLGALETAVNQIGQESAETARRLADLAGDIRAIQAGRDEGDSGISAAALERIEERLGRIADRLSELESAAAETAGAVSPEEVETLAEAIGAAADQRRRLTGEIETLSRRLAALGALSRATARRAPAMMQSRFARAGRRDAGRPYEAPLRRIEEQLAALPEAARVGAETALAALRPHAATGLATAGALADRFGPVAAAMQRAEPVPDEAGFFERLGRRLASIVVVRPKAAGEGEELPARLARAEAALAAGQLEAAVRELSALPEPVRAPAGAWLADARARLEAEGALRALMAVAGAPVPDESS